MKKYSFPHILTLCMTLLCVFFTSSSQAQNTTAMASVSQTQVATNEVFQLKVSVDQRVSRNAVNFANLKQDFYVGRTNFGSSTTSINGNTSISTEWTVTLSPIKAGTFIIPSFNIDGAHTQPIRIDVSKDSQAPSEKQMVEFQSNLSQSKLYPKQSAILHAKLIIKADPRRLQDPQISAPSVKGMSLKPLGEAKQYQSVLNGLEVTIVEQLFRVTAEQAGQYNIQGPTFSGGAIYTDPRTGGTRLMHINTQAKVFPITVMPVPASFNGQWLPTSHLELTQQWQDENGQAIHDNAVFNTEVGQSITRIIILSVNDVTQQQLPTITINNPDSVRVYAEKPQYSTTATGAVKMTLKQVLIANKTGKIVLPAINLPWWDSISKQQQSSHLAGLTLNAKPSSQAVIVNSPAPQAAPTPSKTITVHDSGYWPYFTVLFAALWLMTLAWTIYVYQRKTPAIQQDKQYENHADSMSIEAIIQSGDKVKIQHHVVQWLDDNAPLNEDFKTQVHAQLNMMNQSYAVQQTTPWSHTALLALIKKGHKYRSNEKSTHLAKL